jgi:hypothetical protein
VRKRRGACDDIPRAQRVTSGRASPDVPRGPGIAPPASCSCTQIHHDTHHAADLPRRRSGRVIFDTGSVPSRREVPQVAEDAVGVAGLPGNSRGRVSRIATRHQPTRLPMRSRAWPGATTANTMDGGPHDTRRAARWSPRHAVAESAWETRDRTVRRLEASVRRAVRVPLSTVSSEPQPDSTLAMTNTRPRTRARVHRYLTLRIGSIASPNDLSRYGLAARIWSTRLMSFLMRASSWPSTRG